MTHNTVTCKIEWFTNSILPILSPLKIEIPTIYTYSDSPSSALSNHIQIKYKSNNLAQLSEPVTVRSAHLHELGLMIAWSCRIWMDGGILGFVERHLLYLLVYKAHHPVSIFIS
jgi:hypothetical protein